MTKQEKAKEKETTQNTDVAALLKAQEEQFKKLLAAQNEAMQSKLDEMKQQNTKLNEELANLKTNTEEENALLGEKLAKISPTETPEYNPFKEDIMYRVYNEDAKAETVMTGDEVEGIVGLREDIAAKLKKGAKEFDKFPYKVKLIENK